MDHQLPDTTPRVSVVTVTLNSREFVEDTIRSVLAQSYSNVEYVVIDGGSTDGTAEIVRAYASRLAAWVSERDAGIADAFNKGLARVSGDYVIFLNSDDRFATPNSLALLMLSAKQADWPALVCGDCELVQRGSGQRVTRLNVRMTPLGILLGRMSPHPAMLTHKSYFAKYGGFDPSFRIAMDFDLVLRGALHERIVYVPEVITIMRSGGLSTRHRSVVVEEIVRALRKNGNVRTRLGERLVRVYFRLRGKVGSGLKALSAWTRTSR